MAVKNVDKIYSAYKGEDFLGYGSKFVLCDELGIDYATFKVYVNSRPENFESSKIINIQNGSYLLGRNDNHFVLTKDSKAITFYDVPLEDELQVYYEKVVPNYRYYSFSDQRNDYLQMWAEYEWGVNSTKEFEYVLLGALTWKHIRNEDFIYNVIPNADEYMDIIKSMVNDCDLWLTEIDPYYFDKNIPDHPIVVHQDETLELMPLQMQVYHNLRIAR